MTTYFAGYSTHFEDSASRYLGILMKAYFVGYYRHSLGLPSSHPGKLSLGYQAASSQGIDALIDLNLQALLIDVQSTELIRLI